jgi:hypothetical protein
MSNTQNIAEDPQMITRESQIVVESVCGGKLELLSGCPGNLAEKE